MLSDLGRAVEQVSLVSSSLYLLSVLWHWQCLLAVLPAVCLCPVRCTCMAAFAPFPADQAAHPHLHTIQRRLR